MKSPSAVAVANEKVSIVAVCQMLGVDLPDDVAGGGRSRKVRCPFGEIYHSDAGVSPAMRIYPDTNTAYCFSCSMHYTPVSLAARAMDVDWPTAAIRLLDRIGYRPVELAEQFQQAARFTPEVNKPILADALKTYCGRIDQCWSKRQFEPRVAGVLTRCLSLLDLVKTAEDVTLWLSRCKEVMRCVLHVEEESPSEKYDVLLKTIQRGHRGGGS